MGKTSEQFFTRGGFALLVVVIGGFGLVKSAHYYGTLLRGFDAQFYYATARSLVVSGEFDVTDDMPFTPAKGPFETEAGIPHRPDGGVKNVFPVGLSLVEAAILFPARAAADTFAPGLGPPGYTSFEVGCVAAGLLIIAAVGLQITFLFTRSLVSPSIAALITLAAWAGTPLLYYTAWFPFSAHPTTFTVMAMLLLVADWLPRMPRLNAGLFAFGVFAALLFLTRPHQSLYVIILVAWRVVPLLTRRPRAWLPGAILGLAVCAAAISLQVAVHGMNTGTPALTAHGQHDHPMISGHFETTPRFDVVLGSPTRGLFVVTPLVALSLAGYICWWRLVPWWGWASLLNAALQTTILAFWSDPAQGDSFGIRLWGEHLPVVVCGLALIAAGTREGRTTARASLAAAIVACVVWTTVLCGSYVTGRLRGDVGFRDIIVEFVQSMTGWRQ